MLEVREDCVFQAVTGVRSTTSFPRGQVLAEPGMLGQGIFREKQEYNNRKIVSIIVNKFVNKKTK